MGEGLPDDWGLSRRWLVIQKSCRIAKAAMALRKYAGRCRRYRARPRSEATYPGYGCAKKRITLCGHGAQRAAPLHGVLRGAAQSERRASMTSMRAAREAGHADAITAALSKTRADTITGSRLGIRMSIT